MGDRAKCISAGASDYITKPVDIDPLLSLLGVWLYESGNRVDETDGKRKSSLLMTTIRVIFLRLLLSWKQRAIHAYRLPGSLEALKLLSSNHEVGIVLLDMMMPDMDGYEMLTTLRKGSNADLPVIAVTAQAMLGDRESASRPELTTMSKPVDIDKLVDILDKIPSEMSADLHLSDEQIEVILSDLIEHYGYDFTNYSAASLKRRIQRLLTLDKVVKFCRIQASHPAWCWIF